MKKIYYLAYYDIPTGNTDVVLAATNKMNYIIDVLTENGYEVVVVSASVNRNGQKVRGEFKQIRNNVFLKTFDSNISKIKLLRLFQFRFLKHKIKKYFRDTVKINDKLLIYHSLGYAKLYKWFYQKLKAKVILETEEIYSDVTKVRGYSQDKEIQCLAWADAYIFPTSLLNEKINKAQKPNVIIHGTYNVEKDYGDKFNDGKVHCVYAGTFDPRKGGVAAAAAAGQFLNENYHVHILGFGSEKDKELLINQIDDISRKTKCKITFEGLKSGEEYNRFIQKCDIGLSTQNPDAAFNDTSFPSKILSYMANGLRVVSIRIPAVENSAIGEFMYYYNEQTPQKIAEAIVKVDLNDGYDGRAIIKLLDKKFISEIKVILEIV